VVNSSTPILVNPSAPFDTKKPDVCPYCSGHAFTRRGTRKKKFEIVQLWRCASCKRMLTPAPATLRNKTYPLRVIIEALTTYNLGYSHEETIRHIKARTGRAIPDSTLSNWIAEHHDLMSYRRLRDAGRKRFPPEQTVRSVKLYHCQVYRYSFHQPKLEFVRESDEHGRFAPVADFLEAIPTICPHTLFRNEDASGRASQVQPVFADPARIVVNRKENTATRAAALIIPTVGNNRERHERLQQFMLANDSVTLAVEVPIWLTEDDIVAIEGK
jgi:hypothetical protein